MDDLLFEDQPLNPLFEACYEGNIEKVTKLLDYDSTIINSRSNSGDTVLHVAAQSGFLDLVNVLIYRGADVNLLTEDGWTPLHFAAQRGYVDVMKALIKAGVKIDLPGIRYHRTALHYAADHNQFGAVSTLLAVGANKDLLDIFDNTAFDLANKKGYVETASLLAKKS